MISDWQQKNSVSPLTMTNFYQKPLVHSYFSQSQCVSEVATGEQPLYSTKHKKISYFINKIHKLESPSTFVAVCQSPSLRDPSFQEKVVERITYSQLVIEVPDWQSTVASRRC